MSRALDDSAWVRSLLVQGSTLIAIDENTYKALTPNGDTWAPSSAIRFLGTAGVGFGCRLDLDNANASIVTGPPGIVSGTSEVRGHVVLGRLDAQDVPFFGSGVGYVEWIYRSPFGTHIDGESGVKYAGFVGSRDAIRTNRGLVKFGWRLRTHGGATLNSATVQFRVTLDRSAIGVPASLPAIRVFRADRTGKIEPLRAKDANTDDDGFLVLNPTPASGNAYDLGGAAQSFVYTTNQNSVVDPSLYEYFFEVREEGGANSWTPGSANGNEWHTPSATLIATRFEPA